MVGRELPNLRPSGEDQRGAGGGRKGAVKTGTRRDGSSRWMRTRTRLRTGHKALV